MKRRTSFKLGPVLFVLAAMLNKKALHGKHDPKKERNCSEKHVPPATLYVVPERQLARTLRAKRTEPRKL
jgi:hypothetical protein